MKSAFRRLACARLALVFLVVLGTAPLQASTGQVAPPKAKSPPGIEAAQTISMITGVAISPLLGVGAVGAYQYWKAAPAERSRLPWFAQPWFFIPALILVAFVAAKDIVGTAAPTTLKKPFDVAEAVENKVSGLVAAGAFVPLVVSIFPQASGSETALLSTYGFAGISLGSVGNALMVPVAIVAFAVVWLAAHAINMLILLSPFTTVDAGLKSLRFAILGLVTGTAFANPYVGAVFALLLIIVAWLVAGWSFRLMVFGLSFIWDFATLRRFRFQPGAERNTLFTAREIEGAPIRTYGSLVHRQPDTVYFEYRPWLVLPKRRFNLPPGSYCVGRALLCPEISLIQEARLIPMFLLAPRYRGHEEALGRAYNFNEVRDVGLLKGFKAVWNWLCGSSGAGRIRLLKHAETAELNR